MATGDAIRGAGSAAASVPKVNAPIEALPKAVTAMIVSVLRTGTFPTCPANNRPGGPGQAEPHAAPPNERSVSGQEQAIYVPG